MGLFDLVFIIIFLLLNAIFVLLEFAIVKVRPTKLEELSSKESVPAKVSLEIVSNINSYLAAIQLGITIASIGLGWKAQPFVSSILKKWLENINLDFLVYYSYVISIFISFIIVTFAHIVIGEQVPKYIAISISEKVILTFAIPLKIFYKLTYYPMLFINKSSEYIIKFLGIKKLGDDFHHSEDEIKIILSRTEDIGKITLQRLMMFEHIFDFGKTIVKEIMIPIDKVVFLDINSSYNDFLDTLKNSKFSRYPIKKGDRFEGFIHIKDVFLNSLDQNNFDLKKIIREIKIINENMLAEKALSFFQENNIQFALVYDIKGEIKGILTIEDIVEEICGEIRDEFEKRPVYRLDAILNEHSSVMNLKSVDRFSAISELIDKIFENKVLINPISINEIREKVIKREKSFSTAIGHQFAIPHARVEGLKKPIIVIGRSEKGIHFNSPDLKPVKFIFLILTPYADSSIQLNILAKISKLISNVTLRNKLLKAKTIDKVKEILTIFEDSIPLD